MALATQDLAQLQAQGLAYLERMNAAIDEREIADPAAPPAADSATPAGTAPDPLANLQAAGEAWLQEQGTAPELFPGAPDPAEHAARLNQENLNRAQYGLDPLPGADPLLNISLRVNAAVARSRVQGTAEAEQALQAIGAEVDAFRNGLKHLPVYDAWSRDDRSAVFNQLADLKQAISDRRQVNSIQPEALSLLKEAGHSFRRMYESSTPAALAGAASWLTGGSATWRQYAEDFKRKAETDPGLARSREAENGSLLNPNRLAALSAEGTLLVIESYASAATGGWLAKLLFKAFGKAVAPAAKAAAAGAKAAGAVAPAAAISPKLLKAATFAGWSLPAAIRSGGLAFIDSLEAMENDPRFSKLTPRQRYWRASAEAAGNVAAEVGSELLPFEAGGKRIGQLLNPRELGQVLKLSKTAWLKAMPQAAVEGLLQWLAQGTSEQLSSLGGDIAAAVRADSKTVKLLAGKRLSDQEKQQLIQTVVDNYVGTAVSFFFGGGTAVAQARLQNFSAFMRDPDGVLAAYGIDNPFVRATIKDAVDATFAGSNSAVAEAIAKLDTAPDPAGASLGKRLLSDFNEINRDVVKAIDVVSSVNPDFMAEFWSLYHQGTAKVEDLLALAQKLDPDQAPAAPGSAGAPAGTPAAEPAAGTGPAPTPAAAAPKPGQTTLKIAPAPAAAKGAPAPFTASTDIPATLNPLARQAALAAQATGRLVTPAGEHAGAAVIPQGIEYTTARNRRDVITWNRLNEIFPHAGQAAAPANAPAAAATALTGAIPENPRAKRFKAYGNADKANAWAEGELAIVPESSLALDTPTFQDRQAEDPERAAVSEGIAKDLNPDKLTIDTTSIDEGPPLIDADGKALNNTRIWGIRRAYDSYPHSAERYRTGLARAAAEYGLEDQLAAAGDRPVLVRVVRRTAGFDSLQQLAEATNTPKAKRYTAHEHALRDARRLQGDPVLAGLQTTADGELTDAAAAALEQKLFASEPGLAQEEKRERTRSSFLGLLLHAGVADTQRRILLAKAFLTRGASKAMRGLNDLAETLKGAVPELLRVRQANPEYDLVTLLGKAMPAVHDAFLHLDQQRRAGAAAAAAEAAAAGKNADKAKGEFFSRFDTPENTTGVLLGFFAQGELLKGDSPAAQAVAKLLLTMRNPEALGLTLRKFAETAALYKAGEVDMFGDANPDMVEILLGAADKASQELQIKAAAERIARAQKDYQTGRKTWDEVKAIAAAAAAHPAPGAGAGTVPATTPVPPPAAPPPAPSPAAAGTTTAAAAPAARLPVAASPAAAAAGFDTINEATAAWTPRPEVFATATTAPAPAKATTAILAAAMNRFRVGERRWIIPTFQGGKGGIIASVLDLVRHHFSAAARAGFTTLVDGFGGSGSYALTLANTLFPNVRRISLVEFNQRRLQRIRYYHTRGDKFLADLAATGMRAECERLMQELITTEADQQQQTMTGMEDTAARQKKAESAGGLAGRLEKAFEADVRIRALNQQYKDDAKALGYNLIDALGQAVIDYASSGFAAKGEDIFVKVAHDARVAHAQAAAFRSRGGALEYRNASTFEIAADLPAGRDVLFIADPPYYATEAYGAGAEVTRGKWNAAGYAKTRDLLRQMAAAGSSLIYNDEAWWQRDDLLPDADSAETIYTAIRALFPAGTFNTVQNNHAHRLETLAILDQYMAKEHRNDAATAANPAAAGTPRPPPVGDLRQDRPARSHPASGTAAGPAGGIQPEQAGGPVLPGTEGEVRGSLAAGSQPGTPATPALTEADLAAAIGPQGQAVRATLGDNLILLPDDSAIPPAVQAAPDYRRGVKGFSHAGRAYIVLGNAESAHDLAKTFWHEAVGHLGVAALLGKGRYARLIARIKRHGLTPELRQTYLHLIASQHYTAETAWHEIISTIAETRNQEGRTIWRIVVNEIKAALRVFHVTVQFTEDELADLVAKARDAMLAGPSLGAPSAGSAAAPADASPRFRLPVGERFADTDIPADPDPPRLNPVDRGTAAIFAAAGETVKSWPEHLVAADGAGILLQNPEEGSMAARVKHLLWDNGRNRLNVEKAAWLPNVPATLEHAAVRLADGETGNHIYVRRYAGGTNHMVVVRPDGKVQTQQPFSGRLITQFPHRDLGRQGNMLVDWERENGTGRRPGVPGPTNPDSATQESRRGAFQSQVTPPPPDVKFRAAPWYSKIEQTVAAIPQATMTAAQLRAALTKAGVKPEELHWSRMDEFLGGRDKVNRAEALAWAQENAVRIEEVTKDENNGTYIVQIDANRETWGIYRDGIPWQHGMDLATANAEASRLNKISRGAGGSPRFERYVIPGGTNYQEILLTLPDPAKQAGIDFNAPGSALAARDVRRAAGRGQDIFVSGHWNEPNVLVHIRTNERETTDGRTMQFIEEIQSDWHQQGRKKGYATGDRNRRLFEAAQTLYREIWKPLVQGKITKEDAQKAGSELVAKSGFTAEEIQTEANLRGDFTNDYVDPGIPDAPFKKSWPLLGFKRALLEAVQRGKALIGWTTGAQQADRYDLSKQVDRIRYNTDTGTLVVSPKGETKDVVLGENVSAEKLSDYIGSAAAQKLMEQQEEEKGTKGYKWKILSGVDLKVGGAGMAGFYDTILPRMVNDYLKRHGAKVETATITGKKAIDIQIDQIRNVTSQASINRYEAKGYIFSNGSGKNLTAAEARTLLQADPKYKYLTAYPPPDPAMGDTIHAVEITPELRRDVLEHGQPLFRRGPDLRTDLDPAAAAAQERLTDLVVNRTAEADTLYDALPETYGGKVIGTDLARYLLPDYETREGRIRYTPATSRPASWYATDRLRRAIDNPPEPRPGDSRPILLMTAGGVASGKSTVLTTEAVAAADLVSDGQMRNPDQAIATIRHALDRGWDVDVHYVFRPFRPAVRGAIHRATHPETGGRWGNLHELPELHMQTQAALETVRRHFAGNDRVVIRAWANPDRAAPYEIDPATLAAGGERHYNDSDKEMLHATVREELAAARAAGTYETRVLDLIDHADRSRLAEAGERPDQPGTGQSPVQSPPAALTDTPRFRRAPVPAAAPEAGSPAEAAAAATVTRQKEKALSRWLGPLADPATWQWGTATGGNRPGINLLNWQRQGSIQAAGREIQADVKRLLALQQPLGQEQKDAILKVVKGELAPEAVPEAATSARVRKALEFAQRLRTNLDTFSQAIVDAGIVTENMGITIEANQGKYIVRAYEKYLNPAYSPDAERTAAAARYVAQELQAWLDRGAGIVNNLIGRYQTPELREKLAAYMAGGDPALLDAMSPTFQRLATRLRSVALGLNATYADGVTFVPIRRDFAADIAALQQQIAANDAWLQEAPRTAAEARPKRNENLRLKEKLEKLHATEEYTAYSLAVTPREMQEAVAGTLDWLRDSGTARAAAAEAADHRPSPQWRIIQHSFKKRKDIPEVIREYYGEIHDLAALYQITAMRQQQILIANAFQKKLLAAQDPDPRGSGRIFQPADGGPRTLQDSAGATRQYTEKIPDTPAYGPLRGMYCERATYKLITSAVDPVAHGRFMRGYAAILGSLRAMKVLPNPATHARNFLGNYLFALADGEMLHLPSYTKGWRQAWHTVRSDPAEFNRLLREGVISSSVKAAELHAVIHTAFGDNDMLTPERFHNKLALHLRRGIEHATALYALEDSIHKLAAYYSKRARGLGHETAAARVREAFPYYDMAPAAVTEYGKYLPFIEDFLTFKAEAIRITVNNWRNAAADARRGDFTAAAGTLLAQGVATAAMAGKYGGGYLASAAVASALGQILGEAWAPPDKEEEKAVRALLPDWQRFNALFMVKDQNGAVHYVDVGYIDPYDIVSKASFIAAGGVPGYGAASIAASLAGDILGAPMAVRAFLELVTDKDVETGRPVSEAPAKWAAATLAPSWVPATARAVEIAAAGDEQLATYAGEVDTVGGQLVRGFSPLRVRTFNPAVAFESRARELRKDLDRIRDLAGNTIRRATPDPDTGLPQIAPAAADSAAETARRRIEGKITWRAQELLKAGEAVGLSLSEIPVTAPDGSLKAGPSDIRDALKSAGWSERDIADLILDGQLTYRPPE